MTTLRAWVHHRATRHGLDGHARIGSQRRTALWMAVFAAARTVAWLLCMLLIAVHWAGVSGAFLTSFIHLSSTVVFVTFISFYCNASTDAANLAASIAALFSADSHHDAEAARAALTADFTWLEDGIARLADLQPGPEALALAGEIRHRLTAPPQPGGTAA